MTTEFPSSGSPEDKKIVVGEQYILKVLPKGDEFIDLGFKVERKPLFGKPEGTVVIYLPTGAKSGWSDSARDEFGNCIIHVLVYTQHGVRNSTAIDLIDLRCKGRKINVKGVEVKETEKDHSFT